MDTDIFKNLAYVWIQDAIAANGGMDEMRGAYRKVPAFVEVLIVGWACGCWSKADHTQTFTLTELRRIHDLVHQIFESGSTTS